MIYSWDCDGSISPLSDKQMKVLVNSVYGGVVNTNKKRRRKMKRIGKVLLITLAVVLLVLGASQALDWIEDILAVYFGAVAPMVFIGLLTVAVGVGYGILLTRDKGNRDD